ncbi:MAG: tyrosine-type recombinase/integrase, partial [Planctomycetota bacterium]
MGEPQHSSDPPRRSRELSASASARSPAEQDLAAAVPAVIAEVGPDAATSFVEFFAAQIRNRNTRAAYLRNAVRFLTWVERRGLALPRVTTLHVAAYIERLGGTHSAPSVKQHLATLRMLGQFLVVKGVLDENPAAGVRGPKHVVTVGKTPVLGVEDVRRLFKRIKGATPAAVRDRALLATMLYTFGRVSAVLDLDLADYYQVGRRMYVRLREKGGRHHEMPLNHRAVEFIDAYVSMLNVGG